MNDLYAKWSNLEKLCFVLKASDRKCVQHVTIATLAESPNIPVAVIVLHTAEIKGIQYVCRPVEKPSWQSMMTRQEQCVPSLTDTMIMRECSPSKSMEQFPLSVACEYLGS